MQRVRSVPPLVRKLTDQTGELADRLAVEAVCGCYAEVAQIDRVLTISHLLRFASDHKRDKQAEIMCDLADTALESIIARYKRSDRIGATGEEAKALRALVDYSEDYWRRQSGALRDACVQAVNDWYAEIKRTNEGIKIT